jgi:hypothetical protein
VYFEKKKLIDSFGPGIPFAGSIRFVGTEGETGTDIDQFSRKFVVDWALKFGRRIVHRSTIGPSYASGKR